MLKAKCEMTREERQSDSKAVAKWLLRSRERVGGAAKDTMKIALISIVSF